MHTYPEPALHWSSDRYIFKVPLRSTLQRFCQRGSSAVPPSFVMNPLFSIESLALALTLCAGVCAFVLELVLVFVRLLFGGLVLPL